MPYLGDIMTNHDRELQMAAAVKQILASVHPLRYLFFELTRKCNLLCAHCGSRCPGYEPGEELTAADFKRVVDCVSQVYPPSQLMFCITGGEPLLRNDWFEICSYISEKRYSWGMTTNGTLIDKTCVQDLARAGMKTVAVSLDGLKDKHERLRGVSGAFEQAVSGIRHLKESSFFKNVQVVTVVNRLNIAELPALFDLVNSLGVDSWKLTAIEPMGDAVLRRDLFLTEEDYFTLFEFIRQCRNHAPLAVTYGCSHLLPEQYDDTVRSQSFLCGAGTMIASIACNGDILPCLDIDCRELVKQGNIRKNDFVDVWENRFEQFRVNKADSSKFCRECPKKQICQGDSWHSWDFQNNRPRICFEKHIFFDDRRR